MSVTFYIPGSRYDTELNVSNSNAVHLLRIGRLYHTDELVGDISPTDMMGFLYNVEQFILDHRYDKSFDTIRFLKYLIKLSTLTGIAVETQKNVSYG